MLEIRSSEIMPRGAPGRLNPLEEANFVPLTVSAGLRSRQRSRAVTKREVDLRVNRALSALKQMWKGDLSDELLDSPTSGFVAQPSSNRGKKVIDYMKEVIGGAIDRQPTGTPVGVAALRRQRAALDIPSPAAKSYQQLPNRGGIWPASVGLIALPNGEQEPVQVSDVSKTAGSWLKDYQEKMLLPEKTRQLILEDAQKTGAKAYIDPHLKADMLSLAVRMAVGKMIRAIKVRRSCVGLFTVVKKIADVPIWIDGVEYLAGTIILRLVFDQRYPNLLWREPDWAPLAGPGAFASIDISEELANYPKSKVAVATGAAPDHYYRLGLPSGLAERFAFEDLTTGQLCQELRRRGHLKVAERIMTQAAGDEEAGLGMCVPPMGWAWAVLIAQPVLMELVGKTRSMQESSRSPWIGC